MSSCNRNFSSIVVDGKDRAPNRSMLRAVGFEDEDFEKPQVAVCSAWSMVTPCNSHLDELGKASVEGVDGAGGKAVPFGTITVSDGISMGTAVWDNHTKTVFLFYVTCGHVPGRAAPAPAHCAHSKLLISSTDEGQRHAARTTLGIS